MPRYELPLKNTGGWYKYSGAVSFNTRFLPGRENHLRFYHGKQGFNIACVTVTLFPPASAEWETVDYFASSVGGGASMEGTVVSNLHIETAYCDFVGIDGGLGGEATVTVYYGTPREGAQLDVSVNGGESVALRLTERENDRCLCTPSDFIRRSLLYVQEIGRDHLPHPAKTTRGQLDSYLHLILVKGAGTLSCDGEVYTLTEGDQIFLDCHTPYTWKSRCDDGWEVRWLHFNGPTMAPLYAYFLQRVGSPVFRVSEETLPEYLTMHRQLMAVCADTGVSAELLTANLLNTLVTWLLTLPDGTEALPLGKKMEDIREYLDNNYAENLTLDALATHFQISKYHMARQFKRQYNVSIINYVIQRRITRSKELLRYSSLPISEIAAAVGIHDSAYFNKQFRKIEGITASEYRRGWANHM